MPIRDVRGFSSPCGGAAGGDDEPPLLLLRAIRITSSRTPRGAGGPVYLCICNAIRQCEFTRAARHCEGDAEAVYTSLGKTPQCRQCLEEADELLESIRRDQRVPMVVEH